ncbi:hypothetical protein OSB04_029956 [Centaurea solstitialis]|uniref:Uncharacterized protein n=1 Tax=Centaurea solstitialis TaxID=347529 RepID=A0AA38S7I1_9ASTR|nr:hypothetical protein OSB04_029956 [Centaurea solstitialis]
MASYVIKKYEGSKGPRSTREQEEVDDDIGVVFKHQLWRTCWREIHPAWLLAYRMVAFFMLLFLLVVDVIVFGGLIGSYLSAYGCYREGGSDELSVIVLANSDYLFLNARYVFKNGNSIAYMVLFDHIVPCTKLWSVLPYSKSEYEGPKEQGTRNEQEEDDDIGVLFEHELWKTCWRQIHPALLMVYRIFDLLLVLFISIVDAILYGGSVFCYYTEYVFSSSVHPLSHHS